MPSFNLAKQALHQTIKLSSLNSDTTNNFSYQVQLRFFGVAMVRLLFALLSAPCCLALDVVMPGSTG